MKLGFDTQYFPHYIKALLQKVIPKRQNELQTVVIPNDAAVIETYNKLAKAFNIMSYVISLHNDVENDAERGRLAAAGLLSRIQDLVVMESQNSEWMFKSLKIQFLFLAEIMTMGDGMILQQFEPNPHNFDSLRAPITDLMRYIWGLRGAKLRLLEMKEKFQPSQNLHTSLAALMDSRSSIKLETFKWIAHSLAHEWCFQKYQAKLKRINKLYEDSTSGLNDQKRGQFIDLTREATGKESFLEDGRDLKSSKNGRNTPYVSQGIHVQPTLQDMYSQLLQSQPNLFPVPIAGDPPQIQTLPNQANLVSSYNKHCYQSCFSIN